MRWSTDAEISQDDEDCRSELQREEKEVCRNWGEGSKCPSSWYSGEASVANVDDTILDSLQYLHVEDNAEKVVAGIANAIVDNFEYPDAEDIT